MYASGLIRITIGVAAIILILGGWYVYSQKGIEESRTYGEKNTQELSTTTGEMSEPKSITETETKDPVLDTQKAQERNNSTKVANPEKTSAPAPSNSSPFGSSISSNISDDPIRFRTQMRSDGSQTPASVSISFTTLEPTNVLKLDINFQTKSEGVLRIWVDGDLVREFDQRFLPAHLSEEVYIGGEKGTLPAGRHDIGFRLDGFGSTTADVLLSNFEIGLLKAVPAP